MNAGLLFSRMKEEQAHFLCISCAKGLLIVTPKVKLVIGAGGEKIKFIQRKTKCRIQVRHTLCPGHSVTQQLVFDSSGSTCTVVTHRIGSANPLRNSRERLTRGVVLRALLIQKRIT